MIYAGGSEAERLEYWNCNPKDPSSISHGQASKTANCFALNLIMFVSVICFYLSATVITGLSVIVLPL